jgi:hypothetical protein
MQKVFCCSTYMATTLKYHCRELFVVAAVIGALALRAPFVLGAERDSMSGDAHSAATLDVAQLLDDSSQEEAIEPVAYDEAPQAIPAEAASEPQGPPAGPAEEIAPPEPSNVLRRYRPITEVTADATLPQGLLPEQVGREQGKVAPSSAMPEIGDARLAAGWAENNYEWSATKFCHGPLYFEEVNLERYGYQCHPLVQPWVSGTHFFLTVPTLPYQMTVHPPRECIYTLGYYRPGSRVPWQRNYLPWDPRAAAVEAGVAVGLVFLIP